MLSTVTEGIVFVEGEYSGCREIGPVSVSIGGMFTQAQLKSLADVKKQMAAVVKTLGGNGIVRFKYGQRSTFWGSIFGLDGICWYGEGVAVELPARNILLGSQVGKGIGN